MFSIKKSPEQIEDTVSGSKKGRWIPWPSQRMANSTRQLNAGDLCVGSGNEYVSVVGGAWAFGSFSIVSISLLRFSTCPFTISLNYLNICGSWFLLTAFFFFLPFGWLFVTTFIRKGLPGNDGVRTGLSSDTKE